MSTPEILAEIKRRVMAVDPTAQVVLYGSYARGEQGPESDIDLLILVDKEKLDLDEERAIRSPLYDLELATGVMISPRVETRKAWYNRPFVTPFFENVQREGRSL
mgnify:CR=1 FL=1